jgi:ribosomal protein L10
MPNFVKTLVTSEYTRSIQGAEGMLLVSFAGLTVAETEVLRAALDEGGARLQMVKNSLAKRALADCGLEMGDDVLAGNVAVAYGSAEATIMAAKVLSKSKLRQDGKIAFRAAVLEGSALSADDAKALADVPDQDTVRAQIVGAIQGPMRALVGTLAALPGGMARVLQAHVDAGPAAEPEAAAAPEATAEPEAAAETEAAAEPEVAEGQDGGAEETTATE